MKNENDILNLVLARLSVMPEHIAIRFGDKNEELDKEQLILHVKKQDEIGKRFVRLQMDYIKAAIRGFA